MAFQVSAQSGIRDLCLLKQHEPKGDRSVASALSFGSEELEMRRLICFSQDGFCFEEFEQTLKLVVHFCALRFAFFLLLLHL